MLSKPEDQNDTVRPPNDREFFETIRRIAKRGLYHLLRLALAAWFCIWDRKTPHAPKLILIGALAYLVLPVDAVPDVLPVVGFSDDLALIVAAVQQVGDAITPEHWERAEIYLAGILSDEDGPDASAFFQTNDGPDSPGSTNTTTAGGDLGVPASTPRVA